MRHRADGGGRRGPRQSRPETIAKILFTSGSTGQPKGVINTQRMLCANQSMIRCGLPFVADEPPVLVDWLPWNHTFGGNHNFGMVLDNGGSLYIDEGKPLPGAIEATVRNLREIAPTIYFNVPKGFEMLLPYLRADARAARELLQSAQGAVLCRRRRWRSTCATSCRSWRSRPPASASSFFQPRLDRDRAGGARLQLGVRARRQYRAAAARRGAEARAARRQVRSAAARAPTSRPAIGARRELTAAAFDEEGFYKIGDALKFADPDDPAKGLLFDGRSPRISSSRPAPGSASGRCAPR